MGGSMTETKTGSQEPEAAKRLTPGNWVAIAAIAVTVLGWVLNVALEEHNLRVAGIETAQRELAAAQGELTASQIRLEGNMKALTERLTAMDQRFTERFDRMETNIERILQVQLGAAGGIDNKATSRVE